MAEALETKVAAQYGKAGLAERIRAVLGPPPWRTAELAAFDEFHVGGRGATEMLIGRMALAPGARVLDVGSGLGGPARTVAEVTGARVSGIDLTPAFVEMARELSAGVGLGDRVDFTPGSALRMPFADGSFDAAMTIHVAVNIADRAGLYREVARVCKPGAVFGIYDLVRGARGEPAFPLPWADTPEESALFSLDETRAALEEAGFRVERSDDLTAFGIEFLAARLAPGQPAPRLGLHLVISDFPTKMLNLLAALRSGAIAAAMLVARRS